MNTVITNVPIRSKVSKKKTAISAFSGMHLTECRFQRLEILNVGLCTVGQPRAGLLAEMKHFQTIIIWQEDEDLLGDESSFKYRG